jgi:hypothetical protein
MKIIKLTKGFYTTVDNDLFSVLNQFKWTAMVVKNKVYAYRQTDNRKNHIYMHRFILNAEKGVEVDHINSNGLDNRKCNLRKVNRSQQMQNTIGWRNSVVPYKGVSLSYDGRSKKYRCRIRVNNKNTMVGRFYTPIQAAVAYDRAALKHFGEFAKTNFKYTDNRGIRFKLNLHQS